MSEEKKNIITLDFTNQNIPLPTESRNSSDTTFVNWGLNNQYPAFILDLYHQSAIHSAIVNQKTNYIIGNGLKINATTDIDININPSDSLKEFTSKIVKDYLIFNAFAVEVISNVFGEPVEFHHVPVHKLRMNKSKTKFWFCEDWLLSRKYITYDRYSTRIANDGTSKIFYFDGYFPSINNTYTTPEYAGTIKAIVTDVAIKDFNLNNIKNHFSPSTIITFFNGANVSEEVKKQTVEEIDTKFRGESGMKYIIDFQGKDGKPAEIKQLSSNDWDKAYLQVAENNINDILIGHQVQNPTLFAIQTAGKLGNTQELEVSYEIFKNNYIQVKRDELEAAFNQLFTSYKAINGKVCYSDKPLFNTQLSDTTKEKVYTINELREIAGLKPLADGDRLLTDAARPGLATPEATVAPNADGDVAPVAQEANDNIKNLTGRQHQQVMRIVRQFLNGKMTQEQAGLMLKSGYGFTDEEVNIFLGVEPDVPEEETPADEVKKKPSSKKLTEDDFELIKDLGTSFQEFEVVEVVSHNHQAFDKAGDIAQYVIDNDIKGLTINELVDVLKGKGGLKTSENELQAILKKLTDSGVIKVDIDKDRRISIKPNNLPDVPATDAVFVMYQYIKRPEVKGADLLPTSRSFCVKLIENDRLYTREEIQTMSSIFGYDVYQFCGGFYYDAEAEVTTSHCRHKWQALKVKRKA